TYSISGGDDQAKFSINSSTGVLTFASAPDYESPTDSGSNNSYVVEVTASDGNGGTDTQTITVTVTDDNDAPVISSDGGGSTASVDVSENQTAVTTVTASDADGDTRTYSISGGADQSKFSISSSTGALSFSSAPNYESATDSDTNNSYVVEVTASDGNGGTDVQTLTVNVTNVNEAIDLTSNGGSSTASVNVVENTTAVTTVTANDIDGDTPIFSIVGGADQAQFSIDSGTGILSFSAAPDYETATDSDTDNSYVVQVRAADGKGSTDDQTITVTVTDTNEAPVITTNGGDSTAAVNVAENATAVTTVNATDEDGDTRTYSISGGADQAKFSIDSSTGALAFQAAPNYESPTDSDSNNTYMVEVTAADGNGGTDTQTITVMVTDENEAPVITSDGGGATASVDAAENQTAVTTVAASDVDGDTRSFSLSGGADQAKFSIDSSTGVLTFQSAPNYETATDSDTNNSYVVEVTASDGNGGSDVQTITVNVINVNEAIDLTSNGGDSTASVNVAENTTSVTTVTATDIDSDTPVFSIVGGTDQAKFSINSSTGALSFASAPDYETATDSDTNNSYVVQVRAADGNGSTDDQTITITVTDANDAPTISSDGGGSTASVNVVENATSVTTMVASDADGDTRVYSISGGDDQAKFSIDSSTGVLTFVSAPNYESPSDTGSNNTYVVEVTAEDGNGGADTQILTVSVTDTNDAPAISSNGGGSTANVNVAENQSAVTTVTTADDDSDTQTYSLSGGVDQALFSIDSSTGELTFLSTPNYESPTDSDSDNLYVVEVTTDDGNGGTDTQTLTVSVTNVNEDPSITSDATVAVAENQTAVTTVTSTDVDGDTRTYSISGGADQAQFDIDSSTGELLLVVTPNYESPADSDANNSYVVEVTASDANGGTDVQTITVSVTNVNENPVMTSEATVDVAENQTTVLTASATDVDGDVPTFAISGGADRDFFVIDSDSGVLTFVSAPDYETMADDDGDGVYVVRVTAVDGYGGSVTQTIHVTVTNVNDDPMVLPAKVVEELPRAVETPAEESTAPEEVVSQVFEPAHPVEVETPDIELVTEVPVVTTPQEPVGENVETPVEDSMLDETPAEEDGSKADVQEDRGEEAAAEGKDTAEDPGADDVAQDNEQTAEGQAKSKTTESQETSRVTSQKGASDKQGSATYDSSVNAEAGTSEPRMRYALELENEQVFDQLDAIVMQVESQVEQHRTVEVATIGTAAAVVGTVSVGYVAWVVNSGALAASMLSAMPVWRIMDPLPVLDKVNPQRKKPGTKPKTTDPDDDDFESKVEAILK
ncbi:cadherin domain-containing protein, partial [Planctomycetota bacterium]